MLIVEAKRGAAERPAAASELPPRPEAADRKPETAERAGEGSTNQNIPEIYDRPIRTHDIGLAATPQASGLDRAAGTWGADQCKTEINFSCFENVTKSKSQESVAGN